MVDVIGDKISDLPPAQIPNADDLYPVVQLAETRKQTRAQLVDSLGIGPNITSLNGLTGAANRLPMFTGLGTMAIAVFTSTAQTLLAVSGLSAMFDLLTAVAPVSVASAATTNIGAAASKDVTVTGTTTVTSLGTVAAGTVRYVTFSGALTLTHNATSLILPGATNLITVAGDQAKFVSLGSGNWKLESFQRSAGGSIAQQGADYIKYADGRLECFGTIATFSATANTVVVAPTVTFPVAFVDTSYRFQANGSPNTTGDTYGFVGHSTKAVGSIVPTYRTGGTTQNIVNSTWEAHGRWK